MLLLSCEGAVIRVSFECLLSICATAGFGNFDTLDVIEML